MTGTVRAGSVLALLIAITVLASMFLIQTNSRTSILIKEDAAVAGSILSLAVAAVFIASGRPFLQGRISRGMWFSLLVLTAWMLLRHFTGTGSVNGPKLIFNFLAISGLAVVMALFLGKRDRDVVLWIMVIGGVLLAIYGILQGIGITVFKWDASLISEGRSSGSMGNPNLLGSFAAAIAPVGAAFLASRRRLGRGRWILAVLFAVVCIGAVIASQTRGSLIGLFAVMVLAPFIPAVRKKGLLRSLALLLVVLLLIGGALLFMADRMRELTDSGDSGTFMVRKLIWSGSLSMIAGSPLTGWGPGSFQIKFPEYRDPGYHLLGVSHNTLHAHCEYLEILVDLGIIGILMWGTLALFTVKRFIAGFSGTGAPTDTGPDGEVTSAVADPPCTDWTTAGLVLGVVALLAEGTVSVALRWPPSGLLLGVLVGLLLASLPAVQVSGRGGRRVLLAAPLALIALILALLAMPEYARSMRSGKELFRAKDIYLPQVEGQLMAAVQSAANWSMSGDPEQRIQALMHFDMAMESADSAVSWSIRSLETNSDELGGWYALGSAYLTRAMLFRPVSAPLVSILESEGRLAYDHSVAEENILLGMAAYDSLMTRAPFYAETHNNLALAWSNIGNPDSAVSAIRTAWDLHAHNRFSYRRQVLLLAPLTDNPDVIHLLWMVRLGNPQDLEGLPESRRDSLVNTMLVLTGTTFLANAEIADSLLTEMASMADEYSPAIAGELRAGMELQLLELDSDIELVARFEAGETDGMLAELNSFTPEQTAILPVHGILKGILLAREGDPDGLDLLDTGISSLVPRCFVNFSHWPLGTAAMEEESTLLLASPHDTPGFRLLFLRLAVNLLELDRQLFTTQQMMESFPGYFEVVPEELQDHLEESWKAVGGPLYCFSRGELVADSAGIVPLVAPGGILDALVSGLEVIAGADSTDSSFYETQVTLYYIFFLSFYSDTPSFTQEQAMEALYALRDAREMVAGLLGEDEVRYTLGALLSDSRLTGDWRIPLEYRGLIESLRSDVLLGELPSRGED